MIQELNEREVGLVSGGLDAMDVAISWAGTVTGGAIGFTIGGPVGGLVGAVGGFALSNLAGYGYGLATSSGGGGYYIDNGYACVIPNSI